MVSAGTVILHADIWQETTVIGDIWYNFENAFNPDYYAGLYQDYYLRQMNYTGYP